MKLVVAIAVLLRFGCAARAEQPVVDFTPPRELTNGCEVVSREYKAAYAARAWMKPYFWCRVVIIEGLRIPHHRALTVHAVCAVEWPDTDGRLRLWIYDPYYGTYWITKAGEDLSDYKLKPAKMIALIYGGKNAFLKAYYRP